MNKFKGTPGPWELDSETFVYATNERGTNIFWAHVQPGWSKDNSRPSAEELKANAAVMRAAPVLLKALQDLEEAARQVMAGEMSPSSIMVERMKAREAIAKALGESK